MSTVRVVGISGSTRRPSRNSVLIDTIGRDVARRSRAAFEMFDVAEMGPGLGAFTRNDLPEIAQDALQAIETADALIVGSPIYKGSYTGLFKHLFDFVDPLALAGCPVILTATGGGRRHALSVEHQFRPLLGFFSALTLPTAVYASDEDYQDGVITDSVTLDRIRQAATELIAHAIPSGRATRSVSALSRVA